VDWIESKYSQDTAIRFARTGALVRIACDQDACEVCQARALRTYAPSDVPRLPIRGCLRGECRCRFVAVDPETELTVPQLVERGVYAVKAGRAEAARETLRRAVALDDLYDLGWLWLSAVVEDREKVTCLKKVLAINPDNYRAKAGLEALVQKLALTQSATPESELAPVAPFSTKRTTLLPRLEEQRTTRTEVVEVPPEVIELREERGVIAEQWLDFAQYILETDPQMVLLQGQAFLRKLQLFDDQALELIPPEGQLSELYVQWRESKRIGDALLDALEAHRATEDSTSEWRAMHEAVGHLAREVLERRNVLRARIAATGGQIPR
jgi:hypothetical protein